MANMKTPELHKVQRAKTKQVKKQTDELRADKERVKTVYSIAYNHNSDEGSKNIGGVQTKLLSKNKDR